MHMKDNYRKNCYKKILKATAVYDLAIKSPTQFAPKLSAKLKNKIFIKREDLQPVFSFKLRGAYNKISKISKPKHIVAASAGNHAQGVAMTCKKLKINSSIVMPSTTPSIKVNAVKKLGAKVILFGDTYDEAYQYAIKYSQKKNYNFVHPYDDIDVIAGQGTIGIELLDQLKEHPDYVFIPVGGGGLLAGISVYLKEVNPKIKIIAVEASDSACFNLAYKKGKPTSLNHVGIFADGVAVKKIGSKTFKLTKDIVDYSLTVSTDEICSAIKDLYDETRVIAEPAGALSLAGMKKFLMNHNIQGKKIATILCGANMNFDRLRHVAERADIGESSEIILGVTIDEKPGSFKKFCSIIGKRSITEFNYRYASDNNAQVFVGIKTTKGDQERKDIILRLKKSKYKCHDLTDNEMAKTHIRYMVGGTSNDTKDERIYRFMFPEKPGELLNFLNAIGSTWNISLFHYRNHGADFGRVLIGLQAKESELGSLERHFNTLKYEFHNETSNIAYRQFLK
jgi:threonine dehydratase